MGISDRRPKPSVQDVFATDTNPAPSVMRNESPAVAGQHPMFQRSVTFQKIGTTAK